MQIETRFGRTLDVHSTVEPDFGESVMITATKSGDLNTGGTIGNIAGAQGRSAEMAQFTVAHADFVGPPAGVAVRVS